MAITLGGKILDYPIIQGGMGVGISLGRLAGNVAKQGCMGVISMVNIGYRENDFYTNTKEANRRAFVKELEKAREIAGGKGIIATNIMEVLTDYKEFVKTAVKEKIDAIIVGAGLPLTLPELVEDKNIMLAPIVSSRRALSLIIKTWQRRYDRLPDFVVLEGKEAGGHLGFKNDELEDGSITLEGISKDIVEYLREIREKLNVVIPLFIGGSMFDGYDLKKAISWGADGIQIGTRFIATEECDASQEFKNMVVERGQESVEILKSPVGLPARAIANDFLSRIKMERVGPVKCVNCLVPCNPSTTNFCISDALINAVKGDREKGLFFTGSNLGRIDKVDKVENIIHEIIRQWRSQ